MTDLNTDGKSGGGGGEEEHGSSIPVKLGVKERGGREFDKISVSFANHD